MATASSVPFELEPGATVQLIRPGGPDLACRVLRGVGEGTFSRTFLARTGAGELVILKSPRWVESGRFDADLEVEAGILPQLEHPNVVRYLGRGTDPASGKSVLGYERGFPHPVVTLSHPEVREQFEVDAGARHHPLPLRIALQLGLDLLQGVEHLHGRGFVHHDIKLANVMIRLPILEEEAPRSAQLEHALAGRAELFLIDIGGSRAKAYLKDLNAGRIDAEAAVVPPQVTPKYAPPEALLLRPEGRSLLVPSMDLYAAAILIYTTITGREPYDHLSLDLSGFPALQSVKRTESRGALEPLSRDAVASVPGVGRHAEELYEFLVACMHCDPEERPTAPEARACFEELAAAYGGGEPPRADAEQPFFGVVRRPEPTS